MLKRIYQELVDIKKELQAIRSNLESREVENFDTDLLKKGVVNVINHPTRLTADSIARRIQPGQNDE